MFAASIVHCLAISQFLDYRGIGFKLVCAFTAFSSVMLGYYSFLSPSIQDRLFISDIQHIAEAAFLLFIFIKYARKPYPNGSIVYIIILTLVAVSFIARSIFMQKIEQHDTLLSPWFSSLLFLTGHSTYVLCRWHGTVV